MGRIFKIPSFNRWMRKAKLSDNTLHEAVEEMIQGLIDADLGRGVVKKRVPLPGRGKRGGARTLLATNKNDRWIFLYGFQKNERQNIANEELEGLQELASVYLEFSEKQLALAVSKKDLLEVIYDSKAKKQ